MSVRHPPSTDRSILHSYIAVSYVENEGAGVGIVQQARRPSTGNSTEIVDHRVPNKEYVYGWTQKNFAAQGIKTFKRCHLRSLVYALTNLRDLYMGSKSKMPRKVVIHSKSSYARKIIAHHRKPGSTRDKRLNQDDYRLLEKILKAIRRLHKMGPKISFVQTDSADPAATRAVILSRRRGRQACASRENQSLQALSNAVTDIQD